MLGSFMEIWMICKIIIHRLSNIRNNIFKTGYLWNPLKDSLLYFIEGILHRRRVEAFDWGSGKDLVDGILHNIEYVIKRETIWPANIFWVVIPLALD